VCQQLSLKVAMEHAKKDIKKQNKLTLKTIDIN